MAKKPKIEVPYKLYPVQKQIMADLNTWWKTDKKHVLIQAPTGTGKTLLHLLFGVLKMRRGHRVIYFSREHAQIEQCTFELRKLIDENSHLEVKAVHIAGKAHSCLQPPVRDEKDHEAQDIACEEYTASVCGYPSYIKGSLPEGEVRTLLSEFKGHFYSFDMIEDDSKRVIEPNMTIITSMEQIIDEIFEGGIATNEQIMKVAEKYSLCPRTLQKWAMEDANLIFAPYNYMVIPRFEIKSDSDIYIIDESHNLDSNLTSMTSNKIARRTVTNYFRYISRNVKFGYLNPLNNKVIRPVIDYGKSDFEINGKELEDFLETIDQDDIKDLYDLLDEITAKSSRARKYGGKAAKDDKTPKHFITMTKFLMSLLRLRRNHRAGFITMKDDFLNINFVDTDIIFRSISNQAHRIIISSGSLYPKYMASYIGLNKSNSIINEYNPPHKNRFGIASVVGSYGNIRLNTKYDNRKEAVFKAYAKIIRDVYNENEHGTLVYFTSYAYRNNIGEYLKRWDIPYFEPDSVTEYRASLDAGKRAVFMSAFRGLGSEGWNFGDDQSRAIILIGIPYLPTMEMQVKAQQIYYNSRKVGLGSTWYNQKAALWLMQSFGRGLRHKDDFTTVYFVDNRITRMKSYFIKWVKQATNWKVTEWKNGRAKIRV